MTYLFLSYTIVWVALFIYMRHLSSKQKKLQQEIDILQRFLEDKK
jgi:CcmD family protein